MLQMVKSFFLSISQHWQRKKQSEQSNQKTPVCKACFKEIKDSSFHNLFHKNISLCHNCFLELQPTLQEFKIGNIRGLAIYPYNEKVQGTLYQYKGCKDYELKTIFLEYFADYLRYKFANYIMIPGPSSKEAYEERGFHHVEEMFECLHLKCLPCIHKTINVKQHNLNTQEREDIKHSLIIDNVDLTKKKILIVDDVFTTGATVRAMIELIKTKNPLKIKILVMAKTIDLDKRL